MSTAVSILSPQLAPAKRSGRLFGKNVWAFGDQALISGSNFVTMVLTARALHPAEFGTFTLAYSTLLLANILQSTLVTQPHNVLAATRTGEAYRLYTTATALCQLLLAGAQAALAMLVAWFAFAQGWDVASLLLAVAPCIVAWQLQEFTRRVLYTESRFGAAFANDCVSYGGQILIVTSLWASDTLHGTRLLTGTTAMYVLASTSGTAALLGAWQIRRSLCRGGNLRAVARENWHFGKWLTGGELLQWCSSLQMFLYIAAAILGTVAAGELRAAQIIFGPTRVFAFYLGSVLPIRFARSLATRGNGAVHEQMLDACRRVLPLLGAYCLLVAMFPGTLLRLMYGDEYAGAPSVLSLYAICAFISYVQVLLTSALTAKQQTRSIFLGNLYGAVIALGLSWWTIRLFGVAGAPICIGLASTIITVLFWRAYRKGSRPGAAPATSDVGATAAAPVIGATVVTPPAAIVEAATPLAAARASLLRGVFDALDANDTPYCVTHGYAGLPNEIESDVDCVVPRSAAGDRLALALRRNADGSPRRLVQRIEDGASYNVVTGAARSPEPAIVAIHASTAYAFDGRVFYTADEIIAGRRRHNGFWVPSPEIEFGCVLINRVTKCRLTDAHAARLTELFRQAPTACAAQVDRFWDGVSATTLIAAASNGRWDAVLDLLPRLRDDLYERATKAQRFGILARETARWARRVPRWLRPTGGLHVVFLGPDGVGKSTVIEAVTRAMGPAFLGVDYQTFAPSLVPERLQEKKSGPHALPPRSYAASLVKAAWWSVCYTLGYYAAVRPSMARSRLVLNHRYLLDAIVDAKRYRYAGPAWLLHAIWRIAPKPDLVILLDAPAEIVNARKRETTLAETTRQRDGYRALLAGMRNGHVVDVNRPVTETVADVNEIILKTLADRVARRLGGEGRP